MKEKLVWFLVLSAGLAVFYFSDLEPFQKQLLCSLWFITVLLIEISSALNKQLLVMEAPDEPEVQTPVIE